MKKEQLFMILQLAGGTFPTGSFSQSWGLETYVYNGEVSDEECFRRFLGAFINTTLAGLEGPVVCSAYDFAKAGDMDSLRDLDKQIVAMKLTKESREGCLRMGKALLRIASEMTDHDILTSYYKACHSGSAFPVTFGLVSSILGLEKEDMLSAFMFSSVSGLVQSGLKLIPLGNIQAQRILLDLYDNIGSAVEKAFHTELEDAFAFCPGLDIASMLHETLPTRLYMS